jgi:pyruvate dehydrogenase E2 component (dihydrolipoamide acetyltransferase)
MATVIKMPALSDTMTEGTLVSWNKKTGDKIKSGDILAEIETDKAVMEFESFFDGVLLYAIEPGQALTVGAVIAVIGKEGEDPQAAIAADGGGAPAQKPASTEAPAAEVVETISSPLASTPENTSSEERVKVSPLAKSIAAKEGISLDALKGSGDEGRIVKKDIEAFIQNRSAAPSTTQAAPAVDFSQFKSTGSYEDVPVSQMRKTIARRLSESKFSAPEFYLTMDIVMDECMKARTALNEISPVKLSFNDIVVKAAAMALRKHPSINASWLGDKIRYYNYVNMGVAVAVEEGLVVPVINGVDSKSLSQIASEIRELAGKANERKLQPAEMQGNTFTISNLGMFGITEFTAIINPPDACILAVGGINEVLAMVNGEVKVKNVMKVTLTCDHRVVDGASGAKFLQTLRDMLENPMRMLV